MPQIARDVAPYSSRRILRIGYRPIARKVCTSGQIFHVIGRRKEKEKEKKKRKRGEKRGGKKREKEEGGDYRTIVAFAMNNMFLANSWRIEAYRR